MSDIWLDRVQFTVAIIAFMLQIYATLLVQPLKKLMHKGLWPALFVLNSFILLRRLLSILEVEYGWTGNVYESVAVLVGLGVSIFMLRTVTKLRKYAVAEKKYLMDLAAATLDLAKAHSDDKSLAYQLALHFVEQRENNGTK